MMPTPIFILILLVTRVMSAPSDDLESVGSNSVEQSAADNQESEFPADDAYWPKEGDSDLIDDQDQEPSSDSDAHFFPSDDDDTDYESDSDEDDWTSVN